MIPQMTTIHKQHPISENQPCMHLMELHSRAFKGIQPLSCNDETLLYLQSNLRVIDPLYGVLRPMDLIQPYRLEMNTKAILKDLETDEKKLADWWSNSVTNNLCNDLKSREKEEHRVVVNLASDEYSGAVNVDTLEEGGYKFIKVVFQQDGRVIAIHAKKARGLMVRYIAENQLDSVEGIKDFDVDGYSYIDSKSDTNKLVFDRSKDYNTATVTVAAAAAAAENKGKKQSKAKTNTKSKPTKRSKKTEQSESSKRPRRSTRTRASKS